MHQVPSGGTRAPGQALGSSTTGHWVPAGAKDAEHEMKRTSIVSAHTQTGTDWGAEQPV